MKKTIRCCAGCVFFGGIVTDNKAWCAKLKAYSHKDEICQHYTRRC